MSASCYNGARSTMWANDWKNDASQLTRNYEDSELDQRSQISEIADDQSPSGLWDVTQRMRRLFESQSFTDVIFYQEDNRRVSISAHRAVLAIASPLFKKMLFSVQNTNTAGMKMEVQISNIPFDAFTNIVKYLYTDEIFFESDLLVQGVLDGAKQFEIHQLVSRCKQYFESVPITTHNVCSKLNISISNKIDILKERCTEFIQRHTLQTINSTDFQNCTPTMVRTVCKLQSLNLHCEKELLDAVMKWLHVQPPQSRKQLLEPLLKCIRFLTFSVNELGDTLKQYPNLVTAEDGLQIMLFLYNPSKTPNFKSLPSWCNKSCVSRCLFNENPNSESNAVFPNKMLCGKVFFPLKPDFEQDPVTELTSLLQMKCIRGQHQIKAIKLVFEKPKNSRNVIGSLTIKVHLHPSGFEIQEVVPVGNSETVYVEFKQVIKARRGDLIDIEAEARNIKFCRFLQFDDACRVPANPHFQCCVASRPRQGKLYFISEIEYGPQSNYKYTGRGKSRLRIC